MSLEQHPFWGNPVTEIKSAFEKAMEKVAQIQKPTKEQKLEWDGVPTGQKLAATFLKDSEFNLKNAMQSIEEPKRPYVIKGAVSVFAANLQLPKTAAAEAACKRAVEGIRQLLGPKRGVPEILERVNYVSQQFKSFGDQQRQQTYNQLKQQFTAQLQQALRQQGRPTNQPINVEALPEFQAEWQRVRLQMDGQFDQHIEEYRAAIEEMA